MERKITAKLIQWKENPNRKPLLVRGARQTGKSFSITKFGKDHFDACHIINFEKRTDWQKIFDLNFEADRIISELGILSGRKIIPGKDLLFFDEIQECPKAITSLRYFYEQIPSLHVIAAGSLIEFALKEIPFPVGRIQLLNMYPMDFQEFLEAEGNIPAAELIGNPAMGVSDSVHEMLNRELKKYFFIGGMPECVNTWVNTKSLQSVFEIQSDLLATFRQDFLKYSPRADTSCLNSVLLSVAKRTGQQIKYAALAEGFSNPTIKKAFDLLETARLFRRVTAASPAGIPLGAGASEKKFKSVMLDVGLFGCLSGISRAQEYLQPGLLSAFRGAMAEQFVGQEILSATNQDLYYWSREAKNSSAEVDYLVEKRGKIIPVEVKSGKGGSLKSLKLLLETYPNVEEAFVFSDAAFGKPPGSKIFHIPLYFTSSAVSSDQGPAVSNCCQ
jgi:uncharacterized protein